MPQDPETPAHSDDHDQAATPPHGDPLAPEAPGGATPPDGPQARPEEESATPPHGDPLAP
jgi:hypothetical protein